MTFIFYTDFNFLYMNIQLHYTNNFKSLTNDNCNSFRNVHNKTYINKYNLKFKKSGYSPKVSRYFINSTFLM